MSSEEKAENFTLDSLKLHVNKSDMNKIRLPKLPEPGLILSFNEETISDSIYTPDENSLIVSSSPLIKMHINAARKLTSCEDVKKTLELKLQFVDQKVDYLPGDSFGFICPNPESDVHFLLERLNITHLANVELNISIPESSKHKRNIPKHLPSKLSLKELLTWCVEIRSVPKKILLRIMAEYTTDDCEKLCLQFLSSQEGSQWYINCIRLPSLNILDILHFFKTCNLPVEKILEYLPPLKSRFYTVASSPLIDDKRFNIIFNVLEIKQGEGRFCDREGVCTGWLKYLSRKMLIDNENSLLDVSLSFSSLSLENNQELLVYKRQNRYFYMPKNVSIPLIMVGPGVGLAPFIGFLQHREKQMQQNNNDIKYGEMWLFYGCRYKDKDFLYKDELERLHSCKVLTHLKVSFSRESSPSSTRYVYENIKLFGKELTDVINSGGIIYVCGDAKHMSHDVQQAFIEIIQINMGIDIQEAKLYVNKLQNEHRYMNDVWA